MGDRSITQLIEGKGRILEGGLGIRVTSEKMGKLFLIELEGKIYSCKHCGTHFALADDIISKVSPFLIPLQSTPIIGNSSIKP